MEKQELIIEHDQVTVEVELGGEQIAHSHRPVVVKEAGHAPVYYIPLADVAPAALEPSLRRTRCPLKGEARYWHLRGGGRRVEDAAWTYDHPVPGREVLRDYVAFYPERVDALRVAPTRG
ncbi:DUF427 domain-containing protein [Ectothiorhodospiraceae bacterium 2226]|nr:DUF427 domain-containing protein [Ectothiorhodospiraceae bacterium 2226]